MDDLRARIGGPWAISWQGYLVSAPIGLLAAFGAIARFASDLNQIVNAVMVSLAVVLTLGLWLLLLDKTLFKNRATKPVSWRSIGFSGIVSGAIFSVGISLGEWMNGQPFGNRLVEQLIANALLITWWGSIIAIVLESRERFSIERAKVVEDAIALELVQARGSETENRLRKTLNKRISSEISEARSSLNAAMSGGNKSQTEVNWQPIAAQLRSIANEIMRPLSRKLWESANLVLTRPSFLKVLRTIIEKQPLRPASLSFIVVLLSTTTLVDNFGSVIGPIVLVSTVAFIWLLLPFVTWMMKKLPSRRGLLFCLTVLTFQVFDTLIWFWAGVASGNKVSFESFVLNVIASLVLILVTSGYGAYSNVGQEELAEFRNQLTEQQISVLVRNKIVSALARDAAKNLHGQVQTRLISCAAAIDRAMANSDLELLDRALVEVNEIFDTAALAEPATQTLTLEQRLAEVTRRWQGLCQTQIQIPRAVLSGTSKITERLVEVIEEAITNSVRHGGASIVRVELSEAALGFELTIDDNGLGMGSGTESLGTELIRLVSKNRFTYSQNSEGGVRLSLLVS